jgi:hypothetical protein
MRVGKRTVHIKRVVDPKQASCCVDGTRIVVNADPARSASRINETFWHELTHAILHAMGNPIKPEERFVREFAKLLSQAIDTARF